MTLSVDSPSRLIRCCILTLFGMLLSSCFWLFNSEPEETTYSMEDIVVPDNFLYETSRSVHITGGVSYSDGSSFSNGVVQVKSGITLLDVIHTDGDGNLDVTIAIPSLLAELELMPVAMGVPGRWYSIEPAASSISLVFGENQADTYESRSYPQKGDSPSLLLPRDSSSFLFNDTYSTASATAGLPTNVNASGKGRAVIGATFLADVDANFPEYQPVPIYHPAYLDPENLTDTVLAADASSDIHVWVTFVHEGAGYRNSLGYFVYDPENPPQSASEILNSDIVIAFPNTSYKGSGGGLVSGDTIQLRNPIRMTNDDPDDDESVFEAGTAIGWVLIANGYQNNSVSTTSPRYFSLAQLNPETDSALSPASLYRLRVHAAMLKYDHSDVLSDGTVYLLGFEDLSRKTGDNDFNDAMFYVTTNPIEAYSEEVTGVPHPYETGTITKSVLPAVQAIDTDEDGVIDSLDQYPEDATRAFVSTYPSSSSWGTLFFEDRWPYKGDYDFNDLVIDWRMQVITSASGVVRELQATFQPKAAGAGYANGLGFELPVAATALEGVLDANDEVVTSSVFTLNTEGAEVSGSGTVIPVLDNVHSWFGVQGQEDKTVNTVPGGQTRDSTATITRRVVFLSSAGLAGSDLGTAPYNPFLVVNVTEDGRGREVHLAGKAATSQADADWEGLAQQEGSSGYKTAEGYPWAINLIEAVPWPIEHNQLPAGYPYFKNWVESSGNQYTGWFQDKSGYRNTSHLYE